MESDRMKNRSSQEGLGKASPRVYVDGWLRTKLRSLDGQGTDRHLDVALSVGAFTVDEQMSNLLCQPLKTSVDIISHQPHDHLRQVGERT